MWDSSGPDHSLPAAGEGPGPGEELSLYKQSHRQKNRVNLYVCRPLTVRMVCFSAEVFIYFFYGGEQNAIDSFFLLEYCCSSAGMMRAVHGS